jgi:cyanate lyase
MSAIDFDMDITRKADSKGEGVALGMTGKFLPFKYYGAAGNQLGYGLKEE